MQQLSIFQEVAPLTPEADATEMIHRTFVNGVVLGQAMVKSIKSQQASASHERERMIKGMQTCVHSSAESHDATIAME